MTAHRVLQAITLPILALGLWQHDARMIFGSALLSVMWFLLHEEVEHV